MRSAALLGTSLAGTLRAAGPPLAFGIRLWASVSLALYIAFWLELDEAFWAGTSAALVCQPQLGASLRKGWFRMIGTVAGAAMIVVLAACFPQDRVAFLATLALWGGACALAATLLHNFASYAAALAGYTAAIVASDLLGATGGANGDVFMLAVNRATEVCLGIVCAGVVLAGTDLGGARQRLAVAFAGLIGEIVGRFVDMLALAGPRLPETQPLRRELLRRVIALEPAIDQAIGESPALRNRSPTLQAAAEGLLTALSGWRAVAVHLARLPPGAAPEQAAAALEALPAEVRSAARPGAAAPCLADPLRLGRAAAAAAQALRGLPARTPSLRLLADQAAAMFAGLAAAVDGLALLVGDPVQPSRRPPAAWLRVPDWLPGLINAGRAFVTIGIVQITWIVTAWPNGAGAMTWAAIAVSLFSPRADQAYEGALSFAIGSAVAIACAALVKFAALPATDTFAGLSAILALYLIPAGALLALGWLPAACAALVGNFVPFVSPLNQMTYDTAEFYNTSLATFAGSAAAAIAFCLLPPLPAALRARRLLALGRRDLRRLAARPRSDPDRWEGRMRSRLTALPDVAEPIQRAQLLAAILVGSEIFRLRLAAPLLGLGERLDEALVPMAQGMSAVAAVRLAQLDRELATSFVAAPAVSLALRARGSLLAITEALTQHAAFFDAGASG